MNPDPLVRIAVAVEKQNQILEQLVKNSNLTNELLLLTLTPEQKTEHRNQKSKAVAQRTGRTLPPKTSE